MIIQVTEKAKYFLLITIGILYFCFWWFYKLDVLPGLHGDEAWVGLKANEYQSKSIDRLSGMTYYTGILQNLAVQCSFKIFGMGIWQLRLPGAIFNLLGLLIIIFTFIYRKLYGEGLIFVVIIASSALFVMSARIAWEVNTFTLFFLSLSFCSLLAILKKDQNVRYYWIFIFWLSNIFGSYNHIIHSCLSVAGFLGVFLWSFQHRKASEGRLLLLSSLNFLNVILVFLLQRYNMNFILVTLEFLPIYIIALLSIEYFIYKQFNSLTFEFLKLPKILVNAILVVLFSVFVFNHGRGLFDVLTEYKFILQTFAYECSLPVVILCVSSATGLVLIISVMLIRDINNSDNWSTLASYVMICYMGTLSLYTTKNSLRYYMVLYALFALYLAFRLSDLSSYRKLFITAQVALILTINTVFLDIFLNHPILIKATDFEIGNGQEETSSAFLPKEPLIKFLRNNNIYKINYLCYPYFVEQPVLFYKLISPWNESAKDTATIDYDYNKYGNGFFMLKTNK